MAGIPYWWVNLENSEVTSEERIRTCFSNGFNNITLGPLYLKSTDWHQLKQLFYKSPVDIVAFDSFGPEYIFGPPDDFRICTSNREKQEKAKAKILDALKISLLFKSPYVSICPTTNETDPMLGEDKLLDIVCRGIYELLKKSDGIFLLKNTYFDSVLNSPKSFELILEDLNSERLKCWIDTGAACARELEGGQKVGEWLDILYSHIHCVSIGDSSENENGIVPGTGCLDLQGLVSYLKLYKKKIPWIIEINPELGWEGMVACKEEIENLLL